MAVRFRGFLTCTCVAEVVPYVEADMRDQGLIRSTLDFFQMGYHPGVGVSAGTHDAGGCFDTAQYSDAQIKVWRKWGCTVQHRYPPSFINHGHGWPRGCPHLAPAAKAQAYQWEHRQNGLVNHGPIAGPWPILGYKAAIERHKPVALTAKEIDAIATAVARKVWEADVAPNQDQQFTGNVKNPTVGTAYALGVLGGRDRTIIDKVNSLGVRLDALAAAVAKLTPKP